MPNATREIRRRIRSVSNTRKVTKAMELVSSSKMRRALQAVLATRPYAGEAWKLLLNVSQRTDAQAHPLLRQGRGHKTAVVLITTNRGLVGGFNTALLNNLLVELKKIDPTHEHSDIILLGKRGRPMATKFGYNAAAEFEKLDVVTKVEQVHALAKLVIEDFRNGKYDRVILAYTDFISTLSQRPRVRKLLPIERDLELGTVGKQTADEPESNGVEYAFEPSPEVVLDVLLARLVEVQLYQAVLESNASEHAARMMAMRNASDAANDLIDDLTLTFNQARQAAITQDLSEISAGRAALES